MGRRAYQDGCAVAHALNLVGERWALLVVRELVLGPKRYVDLQAGLPGAGPTILAQRLRELEEVGVVRRRTLPPPSAARVYELTSWGAELAPVVAALGRWGARSPVVAPEGPVGTDSWLLSLGTFFDPGASEPWTATFEIRLGPSAYRLKVLDGRLVEVARGEAWGEPDARVETDGETFGALLAGERVAAAQVAGRLAVTGDADAVQRLLDAVRMPTPALPRQGA
ncbi:winged helix-turn-helix transcriptional regulator [Phytohabitans flavus]|uniref:winged helix-turn-helix transcriptional regulator n=1 Tax=Phytohabitans flavus TaxID=1076124 RepID=UPI0031E711AD